MEYLKSLLRSTYENVIIDDYIQPISMNDIFLILQRHRKKNRRKLSEKGQYQNYASEDSQENINTIQQLAQKDFEITALFTQFGSDYEIQIMQQKLKYLNNSMSIIKEFLSRNFAKYMQKISQSMKLTEMIVIKAEIVKPKIKQIAEKLKRLQKQKIHNEKVTRLRVKVANIKTLLSYLTVLPKIHLMKISQLKTITIPEKIKELSCYSSLQIYIKSKVDSEHKKIVYDIKNILLHFQEKKYCEILNRFYELGGIGTEFEKLIIKICSEFLKKFQIHYFDLCSFYLQFMSNYHLICRWHYEYKTKQALSVSVNEKIISNLKTPIFQLRKKIWGIIEEHLQTIISEILDLEKYKMLQIMCQVNRFIEIGERFANSNNSGKIGQELYLKSLGILNSQFQRNLLSISQSLEMEQNNEWSRLPVENQYRYNSLQLLVKSLVKKAQNLQYKKFMENGLCYLTTTQKKKSQLEDDWTFKRFLVDNQPIEAARLKKNLSNFIEFQFKDEVVICQSVFPLLRSYQYSSQQLFYLRLTPEKALQNMQFLTEYYIYFIFITFTTATTIKNFILSSSMNLQQKYQKEKLIKKYPQLFKFIIKFKSEYQNKFQLQAIKESKQQKKILRSRVVASESLRFVLAYFQFTLKNLKLVVKGIDERWEKIEYKFHEYQLILIQISDVLYYDCICKIGNNIQSILTPFVRIKWDDEDIDLDIYRIRLESFLKDFNQKLKGISKGEIPTQIIDKIFKLFCKFIIESIKQAYIKIKKINQNGRNLIKNLLERLENQFSIFYNNENQHFTTKLNKFIQTANQNEFEVIQTFIKNSLVQYEQSIKVLLHLIHASKYSENLNKSKMQQKENEILDFVRELLISKQNSLSN